MPKRVRLFGHAFTLSGSDSDNYYGQLPDDGDLTDSVMRGLRPYLPEDAVCVDVGANVGLYSLALSAIAPRGHVFAFEPSPHAIGHLRENIEQNGVANVEVSDLALSDHTGTVAFHDFDFFSAGSFAVDDGSLFSSDSFGSDLLEVPATTLDEFFAAHPTSRLDLIKIDVEGAELAVLAGAGATLERFRPVVVLEFNTFAFTLHQSVLPQVALARLRQLFPWVCVMDREDGSLSALTTPAEEYDFLYDNGIHGPTDNLLCAFVDPGVSRRYARRPLAVSDGQAEALRLVEAMRRTASWRLTAPLRAVRARWGRLARFGGAR